MRNTMSWTTATILLFLSGPPSAWADFDAVQAVNVQNAPLKGVIETIAAKAGLRLVMDNNISGNVSISQIDMTARQLLEKLSTENSFEYSINGSQLIVDKTKVGGGTTNATSGEVHEIILHYATASELLTKFVPIIAGEGKLLAD